MGTKPRRRNYGILKSSLIFFGLSEDWARRSDFLRGILTRKTLTRNSLSSSLRVTSESRKRLLALLRDSRAALKSLMGLGSDTSTIMGTGVMLSFEIASTSKRSALFSCSDRCRKSTTFRLERFRFFAPKLFPVKLKTRGRDFPQTDPINQVSQRITRN